MKKLKFNIEELKVESFASSISENESAQKSLKGGTDFGCTTDYCWTYTCSTAAVPNGCSGTSPTMQPTACCSGNYTSC